MYEIRRGNKYGAKTNEYNGRVYHSIKEANYARELDLLQRGREIKSWEPQYKIDLKIYGQHICFYTIDFRIVHKDDSIELVEVKGFITRDWQLKWRMLEAIYSREHPEIKLSIVK